MDELLYNHKIQIENELYTTIMRLIEGVYNVEGVANKEKKKSTKLVFNDKNKVIKIISKEIEKFAQDNNLDKMLVKDYLINMLENKIKLKMNFKKSMKK